MAASSARIWHNSASILPNSFKSRSRLFSRIFSVNARTGMIVPPPPLGTMEVPLCTYDLSVHGGWLMVSLLESILSHPHARDVWASLGPSPVFPQSLHFDSRSQTWHASTRCSPTAIVRALDPSMMSLGVRECSLCTPLRHDHLGRVLLVLSDALSVDAEPYDWPGIASRLRFCLDPLRVVPVRLGGTPVWSALTGLLDPWVHSLRLESLQKARDLSPEPLFDALATPTSSATSSWLGGGSPRVAPPPKSKPQTPEKMCRLLVVDKDLSLFIDGTLVQRTVSLLGVNGTLSDASCLIEVPSSLVATAKVAAPNGSAVVSPDEDPDVLLWASRLFLSAPARTLPSALSTARRLRPIPSPSGLV